MAWKNTASRRALSVSLALLLSLPAVAGTALAADTAQSIAPQEEDAILVPLRSVSESLDAEVIWNAEKRSVTVKRGANNFTVTLGDKMAILHDGMMMIEMPSPATLVDGKTMVTLAAINDALGVHLRWDAANQSAVVDQKDISTRAALFANDLKNGNFAEAMQYFNANLREHLTTSDKFGTFWNDAMRFMGKLTAVKDVGTISNNGVHDNVTINCEFESGAFPLTVRFDANGEIDDFFAVPAVFAPDSEFVYPKYADPQKYGERELVIGEGKYAAPATLTIPTEGEGPFPVVMLVPGSGSTDRDSTWEGTKIFRDIAYGLATKGIAVLRYEKRTWEHLAKFKADEQNVLHDEYVEDVQAGVDLLQKTDGIDPQQIYVLGHSLGAAMIPRIVAADEEKELAGTVVMGGPSGFLLEEILEQFHYRESIQAMSPAIVRYHEQQMGMVLDPSYDPAHPPQDFVLGRPDFALTDWGSPAWWQDMKNLKPSAEAKTQSGKLMILQADRDFQVPVKNFTRWQQDLAHRTDVTYHSYPKLNHYFTEGEGPMGTAEYAVKQNLPEYVLNDIVQWVKQK